MTERHLAHPESWPCSAGACPHATQDATWASFLTQMLTDLLWWMVTAPLSTATSSLHSWQQSSCRCGTHSLQGCVHARGREGQRDRGRDKRACNPGAAFDEHSLGCVCVCVAAGGVLLGPLGAEVVQGSSRSNDQGSHRTVVCWSVGLQDHPGSTVVTDSVTSDGLTKFIEARGGKHLRWAAGGWDQT